MKNNQTILNITERILYKDDDVIVLDKPSGIAVHKGPKGGVTLDSFFPQLQFDQKEMPQLAHRLDRETSGCLLLGRHKKSLKILNNFFSRGQISKLYLAICCGSPIEDRGEINLPLAKRSLRADSWWMKVSQDGLPSVTQYEVLSKNNLYSLIALQPKTGRTHQLRVHCSAMGFPMIGDFIYGDEKAKNITRGIYLHAYNISIPSFSKKGDIEVRASISSEMQDMIFGLGLAIPNI